MSRIWSWLKCRKRRKDAEKKAAKLAVQLVLNGCLVPPRLAGAKGRIESLVRIRPAQFRAFVGPGGVA